MVGTDTHLQGGDHGPQTGTLLASLIHDFLDEIGAVFESFVRRQASVISTR